MVNGEDDRPQNLPPGFGTPPPPPPLPLRQDSPLNEPQPVKGSGQPSSDARVEALLNAWRKEEVSELSKKSFLRSRLVKYSLLIGSAIWFVSVSLFPKYEYKIVSLNDLAFTAEVNALGLHGWELVFARRASDGSSYSPTFGYEAIFKKRRAF